MVFTGTYEHTIDAKNRLAIPSEIRSQISAEHYTSSDRAIGLYVTLVEMPEKKKVLSVYTEQGFQKRADELDSSEMESQELLDFERALFSLAARIELDKQGRLRLPEHLLSQTELGNEVALIGVKDHMEIHDRKTWKAHIKDLLENRPEILINPRRAMKKRNSQDQG